MGECVAQNNDMLLNRVKINFMIWTTRQMTKLMRMRWAGRVAYMTKGEEMCTGLRGDRILCKIVHKPTCQVTRAFK
jgi:hypothetical protein